jgi:DNA-binding IclR family transcriptional regulator
MASNYRVLSVTKAIGILHFLQDPPKKHSLRTCNALEINKSAASAVLQPLQTSGVIVYDEQSKRCSLDLPFIELASAVSSQLPHVTLSNLC